MFGTHKQMVTSGSQYFMKLEDAYGCHNYHPLPVVVEKAEGVFVWDAEGTGFDKLGKRYFDCLSAYSAVNQGHVHPAILQTFVEQAHKVTLTSRAVYNDRLGLAYEKLADVFGYGKALLMNTGVEAGESAIKFARRWGYRVKQVPPNQATVLFARGNFWGRTIAACGSSDDPDRYRDFGPFGGLNFELVDYGSLRSLEEKVAGNPNIVAFMVEPIQGEMGVVMPPAGYLRQASELLRRHRVLLVADEIQTGLGRTGKMLCCEHDGVRPDVVLLGKALSGGFLPVSAVLCDGEVMDLIRPGEHGSTYGGNSLASATLITALDVLVREKMCENSARQGDKLLRAFRKIFTGPKIKEVRGKGLFVGIEFVAKKKDAWDFSLKMLEHGVIAKPTHDNIIRFSPPLVINDAQLEEVVALVDKSWREHTGE